MLISRLLCHILAPIVAYDVNIITMKPTSLLTIFLMGSSLYCTCSTYDCHSYGSRGRLIPISQARKHMEKDRETSAANAKNSSDILRLAVPRPTGKLSLRFILKAVCWHFNDWPKTIYLGFLMNQCLLCLRLVGSLHRTVKVQWTLLSFRTWWCVLQYFRPLCTISTQLPFRVKRVRSCFASVQFNWNTHTLAFQYVDGQVRHFGSASKQYSSAYTPGGSSWDSGNQEETLPNLFSELVLQTEVSGLGALGQRCLILVNKNIFLSRRPKTAAR
jgi:hypothetical protein